MTRCDHCPARPGIPCAAIWHTRYCALVEREASYPAGKRTPYTDSVRRQSDERAAIPPAFPPAPRDNRVRVGLACPCLNQGGAEAVQLALLRSLDPARFAWSGCVVTGGQSAADPSMVAAHREFVPVAFGSDAGRELVGLCDVLIAWAVPDIPKWLDGMANPPKVVMISHSPVESPWGVDRNREAARVDRWVAVSELAVASIPPERRAEAVVIWNAVDEARLVARRSRAEMLASWGVPEGSPVAGFLGRLSGEKRPDLMVRLAQALPEPWHVVLVGEGHERSRLERAIADAGLDRVHMVGADLDAGSVLSAFDCLVVPSDYESYGLTMAEGLWLGVPVVSTRVGLAKIHPGLTLEIPFDADGETLAKAVLSIRANPEAQKLVRDRCAINRFRIQWEGLVDSLAYSWPTRVDPSPVALEPATTQARPSVAHSVRLAELRRACPMASKAGCGCQDLVNCRRDGRDKTRQECYDCLEASLSGSSTATPSGNTAS